MTRSEDNPDILLGEEGKDARPGTASTPCADAGPDSPRSQIEDLARRHFAASNNPKLRQWERKAHAYTYGGLFLALQILKAATPAMSTEGQSNAR